MEHLAQKINDRLRSHKACLIFEKDLERVWPIAGKERQLREQRYTLIRTFAKAHGWTATIWDPGLRVTFRKINPGDKVEDSPLAKAG